MGTDLMNFMNYDNMISNEREFLTSDRWLVSIIQWPNAVINPGEDFMKRRIVGVDGLNMGVFQSNPRWVNVRGFDTTPQPGNIKFLNQPVTIRLVDYEDNTIFALLCDWKFKASNPLTQASYRASDLQMALNVKRLNNQGDIIREWNLKEMTIGDPNYEDIFDNEKELVGTQVMMNLFGKVYPVNFKNTPAVNQL